ncbi:MAG: hypothetical protein ACPF8W_01035 [Luminiphilus sp.]
MTYFNAAPPASSAVMAFFIGSNQTVVQNGLVQWTKTGGSSLITVSSGTVTLPEGYVWAITTQILLAQDQIREFIFWDGSAEYSGSQSLNIQQNETGSRIAFNVLSTESGSKTLAWRNTQVSYAINGIDAGMQIVGVPK